jgi:GT2 family glycosyltransferase
MSPRRLSVLIPTRDRHGCLFRLLEDLGNQTLPLDAFHVVVVDDGSNEPVTLPTSDLEIELLRGEGRGPAAARNLGLARCTAPITLILNDDARLFPDTLYQHLEAHASTTRVVAVLGTFDFVDSLLEDPFTRLLQDSSLLFDFVSMVPGQTYGWRYFWTCNLSVPSNLLHRHRFDEERFDTAIVEDVELGRRLEQDGLRVLYWPSARALHDHRMEVRPYFERMIRLGIYLHRMYDKDPDPSVLWQRPDFQLDERALVNLQVRVEVAAPFVRAGIEALEGWVQGQSIEVNAERAFRRVGIECFHAGLLLEAVGCHPLWTGSQPVHEEPLAVVVVNPEGRPDPIHTGHLVGQLAEKNWVAHEAHETDDWRQSELLLFCRGVPPVVGNSLTRALYHMRIDPRVAVVPLRSNSGREDGPPWPFEYISHVRSEAAILRTEALEDLSLSDAARLLQADPPLTQQLAAAGWRFRGTPVAGPHPRGRWAPWSGEALVETLEINRPLRALEQWASWLETERV